MDLSLESATEQKRIRISSDADVPSQPDLWDEVRRKIECYLRAWNFRDPCLAQELVAPVLLAVQRRVSADSGLNPIQISIEETDRLLGDRLEEILGQTKERENGGISTQQRVVLMVSDLPEKWQVDIFPTAAAADQYQKAKANFETMQPTRRPMENLSSRMRTSLSRLPSFRLIGAWGLVVILLVLTFIFTH